MSAKCSFILTLRLPYDIYCTHNIYAITLIHYNVNISEPVYWYFQLAKHGSWFLIHVHRFDMNILNAHVSIAKQGIVAGSCEWEPGCCYRLSNHMQQVVACLGMEHWNIAILALSTDISSDANACL